jgi:hypothetical protein
MEWRDLVRFAMPLRRGRGRKSDSEMRHRGAALSVPHVWAEPQDRAISLFSWADASQCPARQEGGHWLNVEPVETKF